MMRKAEDRQNLFMLGERGRDEDAVRATDFPFLVFGE